MVVDGEVIRKKLAAIFQSDRFAEVLKQVYAEKGDEEVIFPAEVHATSKWNPQAYPCIEITLSRSRRLNEEEQYVDSIFDLDCYYHSQGFTEERLEDETNRWARAVEDLFRKDDGPEPLIMGCRVTTGDIDFAPIAKFGDDSPLFKTALITIHVRAQR